MKKPAGVIVISVLYFIGAAFCLLGGILFIAGGGFLATILSQQQAQGSAGMAGMMAGLGAAMAVVLFFFGAIEALVGWGLLKLKNWARIVAIVFSVIGAVPVLFGMLGSLIHFNALGLIVNAVCLAIYVAIIMYLVKPEVRAAFQGAQARAVSA